MGGLGSGGHNSKGRRIVEGQYWLDAGDLKRRGLTRTGNVSRLSWSDKDGTVQRSLRVVGGDEAIRLEYAFRQREGPWRPHEERIALVHHPRHFGGHQTYFLCPKCARTVKRIYGGGVRYLCRQCHGLVHASTQEQPRNRAMRKNRKLRRRLGVGTGLGDWVGPKPKGMHQTTFDGLRARIYAAEAEINDDLILLLGRLQQRRVNHVARIRRQASSLPFWR